MTLHTDITLTITRAAVAASHIAQDPRDPECRATLRKLLADASAELDRLDGISGHRVDLRYLSPVPPGYDTILGYLAKVNPEMLELIDKDPEATQRDGFWLPHQAKKRGMAVIKVDACLWLSKFGVSAVNAYPVSLLAERFQA